jgi:hypothetical protein
LIVEERPARVGMAWRRTEEWEGTERRRDGRFDSGVLVVFRWNGGDRVEGESKVCGGENGRRRKVVTAALFAGKIRRQV